MISETVWVDVSDDDVVDMIETAGYAIAYWCERASVDVKARTYTITPDEEARFYEQYAKDFTIGFDDIVRTLLEIAVGKHKVGYPREYAQKWLTDKDGGHLDTDIMDVVIQIACFGEVVFG